MKIVPPPPLPPPPGSATAMSRPFFVMYNFATTLPYHLLLLESEFHLFFHFQKDFFEFSRFIFNPFICKSIWGNCLFQKA